MRKFDFFAMSLCFVFFAICAALFLTPNAHALAQYDIKEFSDLQTALQDADKNIELTVVASFEMTDMVTIPNGKTVTITSAGEPQTLLRAVENESIFFEVSEDSALTISNLILDGNKANVAMAHSLIYNFGTLTLLDGAVLYNNNADFGGGIYNCGSCFISGDALISGNSVSGEHTGSGGGVMNSNFKTFEMTDGIISNNTASKCGGGLDFSDSAGTATIAGTAQIIGNYAVISGGGINNAATLVISDGTISNNVAGDNGGGINHASSGDKQMSMTISGGAEISYNRASLDGGGISNASLCELSEAVIVNNESFSTGGGIYNYTQKGDLRVSGSTEIARNTAVKGGGISNTYQARCAINDTANIHSNFATQGGGVYVALWWGYGDAVVEMDGGFIRNNTAQDGSGVYMEGENLLFTMLDGEISGNTATGRGGGVYVDESLFVFNGGNISGNWADTGGGVYISEATTFMLNGEIAENKAALHGGGIYNAGLLEMESGSVMENAAKSGGGVYNTGEAELAGGTIAGNVAETVGDGICFEDGAVNLSGTAQIGTALGNADGIYIQADKTIGVRASFSGFANIEGATNALEGKAVVCGVDDYILQEKDSEKFCYMPSEYFLTCNQNTSQLVIELAHTAAASPVPAQKISKTGDSNLLLRYTVVLGIAIMLYIGLWRAKRNRLNIKMFSLWHISTSEHEKK